MGRERVYQLLQERRGKFFSGQEISKRLGISRAAVWKSIDRLRQDGYVIDARTGLGYRLSAAPDVLVEHRLPGPAVPGGSGFHQLLSEAGSPPGRAP